MAAAPERQRAHGQRLPLRHVLHLRGEALLALLARHGNTVSNNTCGPFLGSGRRFGLQRVFVLSRGCNLSARNRHRCAIRIERVIQVHDERNRRAGQQRNRHVLPRLARWIVDLRPTLNLTFLCTEIDTIAGLPQRKLLKVGNLDRAGRRYRIDTHFPRDVLPS